MYLVAPGEAGTTPAAEALIEEARRRYRRRRRRIVVVVTGLLVIAAVTAIAVVTTAGTTRGHVGTGSAAGSLPTGPSVRLDLAGSLAVGPSGALYVAAPRQHRILVRLPDGRFRVVAGDGKAGFAGDGGPAVDAELSDPSDLAFGPRGALYFVDGTRVRAISSGGVISTVAGNGRQSATAPTSAPAADGGAARAVALGPNPYVAVAAGGQIYVDTDTQILRLTASGRLETVPVRHVYFGRHEFARSEFDNLRSLAADGSGDLYITGPVGWAVWSVTAGGTATYLGYDRGTGGTVPDLVRGPGGIAYAADGSSVVRLGRTSMTPVLDIDKARGAYFWLTCFAFGRHGTVYADEMPGGVGFEPLQQLVSVTSGHATVLWQEPSDVARSSR